MNINEIDADGIDNYFKLVEEKQCPDAMYNLG